MNTFLSIYCLNYFLYFKIMGDYYTEDIPVDENEEEIMEIIPPVKHLVDEKMIDVTLNGGIDDDNLVIEEDTFEMAKKAKLHINELEKTLRNKVLYKGDEMNAESKLRNRLFKLKMLESELKSLKFEIDNDIEGKNDYLTNSIDQLTNEISQVKINDDNWINYWNDKFKQLNDNTQIKFDTTIITNDDDDDKQQLNQQNINESITKFDSRLGELEIQFSNLSSISTDLSLHDIIDDLYRKTNIILDNGGTIDEVQLKITKLLDNCEEISNKLMKHQKQQQQPISLTDEKILKLYQRIEQMPKFERVIPMIYQRLKSINEIVLKGANSIIFLNNLENQFNKIEIQIENWDSKLTQLELQLEENEIKFNEFKAKKKYI